MPACRTAGALTWQRKEKGAQQTLVSQVPIHHVAHLFLTVARPCHTIMTHYLGFVHSDVDEGATPGPAEPRIANAMFSKSALKKTRAAHPLFARGLPDALALRLESDTLKAVMPDQSTAFAWPVHKIFYSASVGKKLFVFVRRPGADAFKCHAFEMTSSGEAQTMADALGRLRSVRGFRSGSMCLIGEMSPASSSENLLAVPLPHHLAGSSPSSPAHSDVELGSSTSDEEEVHDAAETEERLRLPSAPTTPHSTANHTHAILARVRARAAARRKSALAAVAVAGAPAQETPPGSMEAPCGICHALDGDNWVGLKTCPHQFHLGCIASWRAAHNTCPVCRVAVSVGTFMLRYLGGAFVEGTLPEPAEITHMAYDYKSTVTVQELLRLQFTQSTANLYDPLTNESTSSNALRDLKEIHLIDEALLVMVFAAGPDASVVQMFETPVVDEAASVFAAFHRACELVRAECSLIKWTGGEIVSCTIGVE